MAYTVRRWTSGAWDALALDRTQIEQPIDVTGQPDPNDEHLRADEVGFELRFHWRDAWHRILHKFSLTRTPTPSGSRINVDLGLEIIPPLRWVEAS